MTPLAKTDGSVDDVKSGLQPASYTSHFIEAVGLRLHYLDYGTTGRPPVLCLHGGAAHAHWFDFVAPGFSANHHVRALDSRGHGDSAWADPPDYAYERFASDVAAVVERLELRDFVLIGHSMGGTIALLYAATYPGRVGKLIVVDSTFHMNDDRATRLREIGARPGTNYATREEFVARYRLRPASTTTAPEIIRHLAQNGGRQLDDGSWRHKFDRNVYAKRETLDASRCWDRITIPALLVKGDRSQRITPQIFADVKARCPQIELTEVSHSDHHVTLDNPSGFVRAVNDFLVKHP